jgi:hypothetical protein
MEKLLQVCLTDRQHPVSSVITAVAFSNGFIQTRLHSKHIWIPAENEEHSCKVEPNMTAVKKEFIPVE